MSARQVRLPWRRQPNLVCSPVFADEPKTHVLSDAASYHASGTSAEGVKDFAYYSLHASEATLKKVKSCSLIAEVPLYGH